MPFFRNNLDITLATPREATPHDLPAIARLLRDGAHHYMGVTNGDLPALVASAPIQLLVSGEAVWAVAIAGWPTDSVAWIRGLALTDGLLVRDGMAVLLPAFHACARGHGVRQLFYAGDTAADAWLQPALQAHGYARSTEVIVYEKRGMRVPAQGNQAVRIRRAHVVDLAAITAVDHACFVPQWKKDESILGPAIVEAPYFVVAELNGQIVGYAFATTHFGGKLVHLVRIAVHPDHQGQAIAVRLLADVVSFARSTSADTVALNTQIDNYRAQRLYEWFGFRRTGESQAVLRVNL